MSVRTHTCGLHSLFLDIDEIVNDVWRLPVTSLTIAPGTWFGITRAHDVRYPVTSWQGYPIVIDPKLPPGTMELRDAAGNLVGKIIDIGED